MFKPRNFLELCFAMKTGVTVQINNSVGVIDNIQREDGSGRNWNVKLHPENVAEKFIQTFFREE